ncbi:ureidoglycolate lyase [uncultured Ruegeria sp.]|jgi:ureidoglycolate lyase|uniref:ureidoglycolate lyase n=1 Tax=uncultured Ruegeria sp. TaxID=259304 RepID=UPI002632C921|nr:ureidoglycolate lyase [uncultured Ruegeria sp.]
MSRQIVTEPISANAFAPFGDLIEVSGTPDKIINQGQCGRYHDRARMSFAEGRAGINLFDANPRSLPYRLDMVERHPEGSQAFIPMTENPFLVIVALDEQGRPGQPRAFLTKSGQAVNYHRGVWHGVLTPLHSPGLFAVVDRIGEGANLEEYWFDTPYQVVAEPNEAAG